ncbi:MAG: aminopeptidase P family protein [Desulfobacterales bacterium]|nr:MAG: aminopeptidase P family protein [Desulfobacterales bacterium]
MPQNPPSRGSMFAAHAQYVPAFYQQTLTPGPEVQSRITHFQESMRSSGLSAALMAQNIHIFYLTGTMQSGFLFVPAAGDPVLLVKNDLARARFESPLRNVASLPAIRELPERIEHFGYRIPSVLGMELDFLPVGTHRFLSSLLEVGESRDVSGLMRQIRAVKSAYEITQMRRAGRLGALVFQAVPRALIRPRITEIGLAGHLCQRAMELGSQVILRGRGMNTEFSWQVLSGANGAVQGHHDAPLTGLGLSPAWPADSSLKVIQENEPVMIDFGTCVNGYQADQTRTFARGEPAREFIRAHQALKRIEAALIDRMVPGTACQSLYEIAWEEARKAGFESVFLGPPDHKAKFVGHGVGLEANELPVLAAKQAYPLEAGMTVALELKMVFEKGAVGLENTLWISEHTIEKLTSAEESLTVVPSSTA